MGAHHYVLSPFQIAIKDSKTLENQLLKIYGNDFILKSTKRIERFSPELPDGTRLDFSYTQKEYAMPDEIVRKEFSDFAHIFFEEWKNIYEVKFKDKFYAHFLKPEELEQTILEVQNLLNTHTLEDRVLRKNIQSVEDNYYFGIESIAPQVMYSGYPLKTQEHTSMSALKFLHSYEKMGIYPDEYAAMFLLVDSMKEKYGKEFILAKNLFIAGY
jgi:hypothetical protein